MVCLCPSRARPKATTTTTALPYSYMHNADINGVPRGRWGRQKRPQVACLRQRAVKTACFSEIRRQKEIFWRFVFLFSCLSPYVDVSLCLGGIFFGVVSVS